MIELTKNIGNDMLLGGWFLGGGGGGLPEDGQEILELALETGRVRFAEAQSLDPGSLVITASLVGAPSSAGAYIGRQHYREVYDLFCRHARISAAAFITNETGAHSITNGWVISALTGIPVVDAACNGRAHPTGVMGAMGLHREKGYRSLQAAAGGRTGCEIQVSAAGTVEGASAMIRSAAVQAGGYVTVLRNPVTAGYLRDKGAIGCVSQAMQIGKRWRESMGTLPCLLAMLETTLDCRVLGQGRVTGLRMEITGGFDVGRFQLETGSVPLEIAFMNEYLTAEAGGKRLSTFPELIAVIDTDKRLPVCSAQLKNGMDAAVVAAPVSSLRLGAAMWDPELLLPCEQAVHKDLRPYLAKTAKGGIQHA